jgi:hypothetical protein
MKLMRVRYGALGRHVCGSKGVMLIMAYRNRRSCSAVMDKCSQPEQHNIIHMIASISTYHRTSPCTLPLKRGYRGGRDAVRSQQQHPGGQAAHEAFRSRGVHLNPLHHTWGGGLDPSPTCCTTLGAGLSPSPTCCTTLGAGLSPSPTCCTTLGEGWPVDSDVPPPSSVWLWDVGATSACS